MFAGVSSYRCRNIQGLKLLSGGGGGSASWQYQQWTLLSYTIAKFCRPVQGSFCKWG